MKHNKLKNVFAAGVVLALAFSCGCNNSNNQGVPDSGNSTTDNNNTVTLKSGFNSGSGFEAVQL